MQLKSGLKHFLLCLLVLQQWEFGTPARILAPFIFPGKSHFMMYNALVKELVQRGHQVTNITPFSMSNENLGGNYTEILLPQYSFWPTAFRTTKARSVLDFTDIPATKYLKTVMLMGIETTDFTFEQPEMKKLIHAKDKVGKYDLLLTGQFYNEGALILAHLYQIPIITVVSFGYSNQLDPIVGVMTPYSYAPNICKPYSDHMTLWERINSFYHNMYEVAIRKFWYYPAQNAILRKHLGSTLPQLPTINQLERNISLMLLNSHMPLEKPRPLAFNTIPVGGLHIKPPKDLPANIKSFLDEAKHGAIYFSLGSQVRSADLPPEKLKVFLNVFRSMKQRILWKFENEELPNIPANVMVQKWMPQNDILAHPNVKVFISHGGLFGTQEAVYHGVPVLGMPFYFDQYINIKKGQEAGYVLGVDYRKITEEELRHALTELLENPKYTENIKRASKVFRDRPLNSMDTAMYWINYVIEHRGAPHIIAAGVDLSFIQFYMLDVLAIALLVMVLPILVIKIICRNRKSNRKSKSKLN